MVLTGVKHWRASPKYFDKCISVGDTNRSDTEKL